MIIKSKGTNGRGGAVEPQKLYTVEELASLLRVTRRTLRKYCKEGIFPRAFKVGRARWRIPGSDVLAICPEVGLGEPTER